MNPESFSQDILAKIEERGLSPKPGWIFQARRAASWALAGCTALFGGLVFGTILFYLTEQEWDVFPAFGHGAGRAFLRALPFLWIAAFAGFVALAVRDVRSTERGYRYRTGLLIGAVLLVTGVVGFAAYATGIEMNAHEYLSDTSEIYRRFAPDPRAAWQDPDSGRLAGRVVATSSEGFLLEDREGKTWRVLLTSSSAGQLPMPVRPGMRLKASGERVLPDGLILHEARPWSRRNPPLFRRPAGPVQETPRGERINK